MHTKITITIPKPCHENWQAMTPNEKGKFCGACQKNVIDFTGATDRQILQAYNVNNNLCGRFNTTQLDRDLVVPKEKSTVWLATTSAIISFLSLGNHTADAQIKGEPVGVVQTDQKNLPQDITERQTITESEISGVVYEKNGPIPGANIIIKGTQNGIATDINGEFKIIAKEGDVLICSFIGFKDENIVINKSKYYNINMSNNVAVLGGEIIVIKKRNFVGRAFHKIGNLFR
jgi:CarboxypepD_reg-like domain